MIASALVLLSIVLVCLPPKWDPAIRWKERQENARAKRKSGK